MAEKYHALIDWMERNKCRQGALANLIGISQGHFSAILSGKRNMTMEQAIRASVVTDIPVEKLGLDAEALRILKIFGIRNRPAA